MNSLNAIKVKLEEQQVSRVDKNDLVKMENLFLKLIFKIQFQVIQPVLGTAITIKFTLVYVSLFMSNVEKQFLEGE